MYPDAPPRLGRGDLASAISEHHSDYLSVDTPSPTSLSSLSPSRSCIVALQHVECLLGPWRWLSVGCSEGVRKRR